jgi:hypothetical protein
VWNAFEAAVKRTLAWAEYKETLAAILGFLGHKGLRDRFLHTCFEGAGEAERRHFRGWKYKVVDWKWEYMEEAFARLALAMPVFLRRFDEEKLKKSIGHAQPEAGTIDPKCMVKIKEAQARSAVLCARTEAYAVLAGAVGREARWFGGCPCHDHIWTSGDSPERQRAQFRREVGEGVLECIWRGRRGSELARGRWRGMVSSVRDASSSELHVRVSRQAWIRRR